MLIYVNCRIGAPLEIVKKLDNTEVPESYAGEFECEVSREDAEGTWYYENKQITPSHKYVVSSRRGRHSLSVKDVKKEDQGKYTFKVGDLMTSASLKMKCEYSLNIDISTVDKKLKKKLSLCVS